MNMLKKGIVFLLFTAFIISTLFLPYGGSAANAAEISNGQVISSLATEQDTFTWQKYSHYLTDRAYKGSTSNGVSTNDHIVLNGNVMTFYGYDSPAYIDYLFMPSDDSSKKEFAFTLDEAGINYHSMLGGGFLFNGKLQNGILTSYMLLYESSGLGLYKVGPVDAKEFNDGKQNWTKVATFNRNGKKHSIKMEVDKKVLNLWDNDVQTIKDYNLGENIGNGFGPIAAYSSHSCSILSYFTFGDLKMKVNGTEVTIIPVLKTLKAEAKVARQIDLSWEAITEASSFELEIDGSIVNVGKNTTYTHKNLIPGSLHKYRARVISPNGAGEWGDMVSAIALGDPNTWTQKASLSVPRTNSVTLSVNDKIYVLGGITLNGTTASSIEVYDFLTDSWTSQSMPDEGYGMAGAAIGEKIYLIGGKKGSKVISTVEEYDTKTGIWTKKADMPTPRHGMAAIAVGGKVYVIGGYNGRKYMSVVEEYDPVTDKWSTKQGMPTERSIMDISAVDNIIYVVGGYNGKYLDVVESYDPAKDIWQKKASMNTARRSLGIGNVNGLIYAVGGNNDNGELKNLEMYDPSSDKWTSKLDMPTPRSFIGFATIYNVIFAIGGTSSDGIPLKVVEMYNP